MYKYKQHACQRNIGWTGQPFSPPCPPPLPPLGMAPGLFPVAASRRRASQPRPLFTGDTLDMLGRTSAGRYYIRGNPCSPRCRRNGKPLPAPLHRPCRSSAGVCSVLISSQPHKRCPSVSAYPFLFIGCCIRVPTQIHQ